MVGQSVTKKKGHVISPSPSTSEPMSLGAGRLGTGVLAGLPHLMNGICGSAFSGSSLSGDPLAFRVGGDPGTVNPITSRVNNQHMSPEKAISRGVMTIYREYLGRGPTSARTEITANAASTTLLNSLTKAEMSLIKGGDAPAVREIRRRFQEAMRADITALVEEVTGRKAKSFLSDHDTITDVAVEMVVFGD